MVSGYDQIAYGRKNVPVKSQTGRRNNKNGSIFRIQFFLVYHMKKLLVTGGHGVLGTYLPSLYSTAVCIVPTHEQMPVEHEVLVKKYITYVQPDVVLHMAALTDVDYCEKHPQKAYDVNVQGTINMVKMCALYHIPLIYISTAAVFDGGKDCFSEDDTPRPVNIYGETKFKSEQIVSTSGIEHLIVRIGWLVGGGKSEKKFVSYILEKLKKGADVHAVSDIYGSLIYAPDVLSFIRQALEERLAGIYHLGYTGTPSRYDIAVALKNMLQSTSSVIPVPGLAFQKTFSARRPKREVLVSRKKPFSVHWKERLQQYVTEELL